MITLITGLPGNGKTLYAVTWTQARALKEGRQVYYSGIKDCMVPGWIELQDPTKWFELPPGSIILIDEVQTIMRPRQHAGTVPEFVARLETHRHNGFDLVLITQHPMLLDSNVRRLCNQHFHLVRKFGAAAATAHEWMSVKENCDKNRENSIRHEFFFPKSGYGLYKSAEVHTHKLRIPMRVWLLVGIPLIVGGISWFMYARWKAKIEPAVAPVAGAGAYAGAVPGKAADHVLTAPEYVHSYTPRVAGLDYTAPAYDGVTKPAVAPYPAACVQMGPRCGCYSQQGTKLSVPADLCHSIVAGGFFVAWSQTVEHAVPLSDRRSEASERAPESAARRVSDAHLMPTRTEKAM